ncbi:MAG: hypothetical protein K5899_08680 [Bacteroidaceae bacterium]|nr:hypothetical protein [Bacteroidaceae bacterium]
MKKFLTSVFMLSMVLFSMSVFDSCKDYDEDEYNDLLIQFDKNDANLRKWITANYATIAQLRDSIVAVQQRCRTNCNIRMDRLHDSIDAKADQSEITKLIDSIADLRMVDKGLQDQIDSLNARLMDTTVVVNNFTTILGKINTINSTITGLGAGLEALKNSTYTKTQVDSIFNYYAKQADLLLLDSKVNDVAKEAAYALALAKADSIRIDALTSTVSDFSKIANEALERAKNDSVNIKDLQERVRKLEQAGTGGDDGALKIAMEALERAKNDSTWVKALEGTVGTLSNTVNDLDKFTKDLDAAIKTAEKNRISADSLLQNQIDALANGLVDLTDKMGNLGNLSELSELSDNVDDILNVKIPALEQAYKDADQLLQDSIDALAKLVKKNAEDIENLSDSIDKVAARVDKIDEALKSLITGIVVQATENPVFGSFALPIGVNSNVLMAFYGESDNPVIFPTTAEGNYVKNSMHFTAEDWNMIKNVTPFRCAGNKTLFNEEEGNAGTVYMTVNPGSVDFAGQSLELVNSKDVASKVALSPLKKENDVELMFGYTRAAETNGFYSAKATLKEEDIQTVKINIEDGWKSAVKDALKQGSYHNVSVLADLLYRQFNGILPAQGLKASWTDYNGEHSVYSQYGIAATAIKPLSYSFLEDLHVVTIPGYERAIAYVDRVGNRIKSKVPSVIMNEMRKDLEGLTIKKIELKELTDDQLALFNVVISNVITIDGQDFTINFNNPIPVQNDEINVPTYTYKVYQSGVERGTVTIPEAVYDPGAYIEIKPSDVQMSGSTTKTITYVCDLRDAAKEIWASAEDQFADVNKMIEQLPGLVDDALTYINLVNDHLSDVGELVDEISTKDVKRYIDRLNNKAASFINKGNARIQPILLVGNRDTGMKVASRSKGYASKLKAGTIEFILTSYTAEILTPAFKKHIAVTNVFKGDKSAQGGDAACKLALTTANASEMMNTVINGDKCSVVATFPKGYVYEVAYSALDYSGKISMHKYYVQY